MRLSSGLVRCAAAADCGPERRLDLVCVIFLVQSRDRLMMLIQAVMSLTFYVDSMFFELKSSSRLCKQDINIYYISFFEHLLLMIIFIISRRKHTHTHSRAQMHLLFANTNKQKWVHLRSLWIRDCASYQPSERCLPANWKTWKAQTQPLQRAPNSSSTSKRPTNPLQSQQMPILFG